ncbi:hypothetical protein HYH02_012383 [Chlamydomonas schloesseri]|uniref:Uncharacterized protein n=1 Tax=Chlamydomonas schloesseri TaxID=2026947 RepID=A0A835W215_9CHLO|nr:hypothetical protein HYH02_012383 [Chlamydomonas schloesseri]|eukprot:KAG2434368.1 hypothetical protein HYH02_012383 [Chlamydomonas schloesseri]
MADSDSDDFSVVDSLSAVSSAAALDGTTALLQRGLERGRLAETVEKHQLDVQRAATYCLFKLTEPCAASTATAEPAAAAASADAGDGQQRHDTASAPALAAAGLKQLLDHPRLGMLVDAEPLLRVLVQVVQRAQSAEVLAATLGVFPSLVLEGCATSRRAASLALVRDRCLGLLRQGVGASSSPRGCGRSCSGSGQPQRAHEPKPSPALALAALRFFTASPLADLSQLQPEQRADLAAHATALLATKVQGAGDGGDEASAAAVDCLELLHVLWLQGDGTHCLPVLDAAIQAGCMPLICSLLQGGSGTDHAEAGDEESEIALSDVADRALQCAADFSCCCCDCEAAQLARQQLSSAGGASMLLPLLRVRSASRRVLQLLLWLAAAGPELQQAGAEALVAALAQQGPLLQRQFLGAAGALASELQAARCPELLLELTSAAVEAQPSLAGALLLPDWGGEPVVHVALAALGVGAGGEWWLPSGLEAAALRLLHLLLVWCGPPPQSSLPVTAQELMPALVRLAAASAAEDGDKRQLVVACLHACIRDMSPSEAARCLHDAVDGGGRSHAADLVARLVAAATEDAIGICEACPEAALLQLSACVLDAAWLSASSSSPIASLDSGGVRRLAAALVSWPWLHSQLQVPAAAAGQQQQQQQQQQSATAAALQLLHSAVAVLLATHQQAAVCGEVVALLVPLLVPLLLAPSDLHPGTPSHPGHPQALQLLHLLQAAAGESIDNYLRQAEVAAAASGQWAAGLLPAAEPMLRELLPLDHVSVLLPLGVESEQEPQAQQEQQQGDHGGGLYRWRVALQARGHFEPTPLLQLGVALLSGANPPLEQKQRDSGFEGCATAFALGLLQLPSSRCPATAAQPAWLAAAAADLLRPLAPQLPRQQLAMLVGALAQRLAGSDGHGPLEPECLLPMLMCLAECCTGAEQFVQDMWPAVGDSGKAALCDALVEGLTGSGADAAAGLAERPGGAALLKLSCHWCQNQGPEPADGAPAAVGRLAVATLLSALRSCTSCESNVADGLATATADAASPPSPPATADAQRAALLADCVLAVCDGALPALYGAPRQDWGGVRIASTASSAGLDPEQEAQLQRLTEVLQLAQSTLALRLEDRTGSEIADRPGQRVAAGETSTPTETPNFRLLVRALLRAAQWTACLQDMRYIQIARRATEAKAAAEAKVEVCMKTLKHLRSSGRQQLTPEETEFLSACKSGALALVKQLQARIADPDVVNAYGQSGLYLAALGGHLEVVKHLIAEGASMNTSAGCDNGYGGSYSRCGGTALHVAAQRGDKAMVQLLLAAGASKSIRNQAGYTPEQVACPSMRSLLQPATSSSNHTCF